MLLFTDLRILVDRILVRSKQPWLLSTVLFSSVLTASPALAEFSAVTQGTVESGPSTQLLKGVLINNYDLTKAGLANSILQERAIAGYTFPGVGPANLITLNQTFSLQVSVNNLVPSPQNINMNVSGVVNANFLSPPVLYGPFTVEQRGNMVPPIPIKGPNNGLVAQTHEESVIWDKGPVPDPPPPPVPNPPPPVTLSDAVATNQAPGGAPAISYEQFAAVKFLHEVSKNGGPFQPYGFVDFYFEKDGVPKLDTDFDNWSLVIIPTPTGFDIIGMADLARDFPVNPGDNFQFRHTADAQLRTEVIGIPEPSSTLSLLALGTLGAASTLKRKLKPSKSSEKETTKVG